MKKLTGGFEFKTKNKRNKLSTTGVETITSGRAAR